MLQKQQSIETTQTSLQTSKLNDSPTSLTPIPTTTPSVSIPTTTPSVPIPTTPTIKVDLITRKPQTTRPPLTDSPASVAMKETMKANLNSAKQKPTSLNSSFWNCLDSKMNKINNPSIILTTVIEHTGLEAAKLCNQQKPECSNKDCLATPDTASTQQAEIAYNEQQRQQQEALKAALAPLATAPAIMDLSNMKIDLSGFKMFG